MNKRTSVIQKLRGSSWSLQVRSYLTVVFSSVSRLCVIAWWRQIELVDWHRKGADKEGNHVCGGRGLSPVMSPGRETMQLQIKPADVPALGLKLGALVVLLSVTLLFGFSPLCLVRRSGLCSVSSGEERDQCDVVLLLAVGGSTRFCCCRVSQAAAGFDQLLCWRCFSGHLPT